MKRRVNVIGVGMTKFAKPGASDDYHVMAKAAGLAAMKDAGIQYSDVEQAFCGYVYGDSTCGQRAVYELGLTGIPVVNVNNNCSTGSSALFLARQAIEGGLAECVIALGFEKMERGALGAKFNDRENPMSQHAQVMMDTQFHFTTDLQFGSHEGIQGVVDHPFGGVFHRYHTVVSGAGFHFPEHFIDGTQRHGLHRMAKMLQRGLLGEGALRTQEGHLHALFQRQAGTHDLTEEARHGFAIQRPLVTLFHPA